MKTLKYITQILFAGLLVFSSGCDQEQISLQDPDTPTPEPACPEGASAGSADFSKFVAIGNSFVAGVQGGALFTEGQNNSLAAILNKQFECVGAPSTFNQPTIGASLGWNLFVTQPFLSDNTKPILGRLLLQYGTTPDCARGTVSPKPTPQAYGPGNLEALPNPTFNPGFIYTGSKTELNNFGVAAVTLGQLLTPATGDWSDPDPTHGFSPFYARFASAPGSSSIIADAAAAGGSFFLFWAGLDDFFLYAAFGGDDNMIPTPISSGLFGAYLNAALNTTDGLLASNPDLKGVLGNYPDIFKMPHFTSVSYNPVPLDANTVTALTAGFSGYNAALDGLIANAGAFGVSPALATELATRKVSFEVSCTNKILIIDETLTDLGDYFDALLDADIIDPGQRAGLAPYEQVRQTTPTDIIPLATGSIIGTPGTFGVNGVSEPLGDRWVIVPAERDEINAARTAYNTVVANFVTANSSRLALADINTALDNFVAARAHVQNGVTITPNINPPTGIYSEDGVHPNTRGYAFLGGVFVDAINTTFGASIPKPSLAVYKATGLPIE